MDTPKHLKAIGLLSGFDDSEESSVNALMKMALEKVRPTYPASLRGVSPSAGVWLDSRASRAGVLPPIHLRLYWREGWAGPGRAGPLGEGGGIQNGRPDGLAQGWV